MHNFMYEVNNDNLNYTYAYKDVFLFYYLVFKTNNHICSKTFLNQLCVKSIMVEVIKRIVKNTPLKKLKTMWFFSFIFVNET